MHRMRTEIVPYEVIMRVTVRGYRAEAPRLGFDLSYAPRMVVDEVGQSSPEAALAAASVCQSDSSSL